MHQQHTFSVCMCACIEIFFPSIEGTGKGVVASVTERQQWHKNAITSQRMAEMNSQESLAIERKP